MVILAPMMQLSACWATNMHTPLPTRAALQHCYSNEDAERRQRKAQKMHTYPIAENDRRDGRGLEEEMG